MSSLPELLSFDLHAASAIPEQFLAESRSNATAVGYANGWSQALREVHALHAGERARSDRRIADVSARHAEALQSATFALHEAAGQLEQRMLASYDELSEVILAAAIDVAEALLGRELSDPTLSAAAALTRVLKLVPEDEPVTIWLSRSDHYALTATEDFANSAGTGRVVQLQIDDTLEPGDAIGRSGATAVQAKITEGLERLKRHLKK